MKLSGTNLGKLLLRVGIGIFILMLGLQFFDSNFSLEGTKIFEFVGNNQILQNIISNGYVILGAFLIFGFLTSYSSFIILILWILQIKNFETSDVLMLMILASLIFLGAGKYSLDYLYRKKSTTQKLEEKYFEQKKSKPFEILKPHIEHEKTKIQVVTKTKNIDDDEGKTIIEV